MKAEARRLPGIETIVDHFDKKGTLYPFVIDPLVGSVEENVTRLNEGDSTIHEFGIKVLMEKAFKQGSWVKIMKVARAATQPDESVWNPIGISDKDSKFHGGKAGLGEPTLRNTERTEERIMISRLPDTSTTITIKFVNEINLLQWAREWRCSVDEIYQPLEFEKEEGILVESKDVKRVIEDVIDLDDDEEINAPKRRKLQYIENGQYQMFQSGSNEQIQSGNEAVMTKCLNQTKLMVVVSKI